MTFSDLPAGWAERPVTDPAIFADVADLVATEQSRRSGCLYVLICDDTGRMLRPMAFEGWPYDDARPEQSRHFNALCGMLAHAGAKHIVLIIARRGHHAPTGNDYQFRAAVDEVSGRNGIVVLGMAIATPLAVAVWPPEQPRARRSA